MFINQLIDHLWVANNQLWIGHRSVHVACTTPCALILRTYTYVCTCVCVYYVCITV